MLVYVHTHIYIIYLYNNTDILTFDKNMTDDEIKWFNTPLLENCDL